jgi:hypothetical protein
MANRNPSVPPKPANAHWVQQPKYWRARDAELACVLADHPMNQFRNLSLQSYQEYESFLVRHAEAKAKRHTPKSRPIRR